MTYKKRKENILVSPVIYVLFYTLKRRFFMKKFLMLFLGISMIPSISTAAPQASKEEVRSPFVFSNLAPTPNAAAKSLGVDLYLTGSGFLPLFPLWITDIGKALPRISTWNFVYRV